MGKKKRVKCGFSDCKRKLTVVDTSIPCSCKGVFCPTHRPKHKHECTVENSCSMSSEKTGTFEKVATI